MKTALALFLTTAALADEPRHFDFTVPFVGFDGNAMHQTDAKGAALEELLTLGDVSVVALETLTDEDRSLAPDKKFQRDELARKIYRKPDVILEAQDVALIKERIGKVHAPMIVGSAWRLLDPAVGAR